MTIRKEILDELLQGYSGKPEDFWGKDGLLKDLTKALVERALQGELSHHLGYEKHEIESKETENSRNGKYQKTVKGNRGKMRIDIPRDRKGEFDPILIKKGETRIEGFDDRVLSMYARGMSVREIQEHIEEIYGISASPDLISKVTDAVVSELKEWQNRPLDAVYPIVYMDALFAKSREQGHVQNRAVYLAIGVNMEGKKEALGLWIEETEGAKFWLEVATELKNRGVQDIFIACMDGLKGFPEAMEAVFPRTEIQLCIVHMIRGSLRFVPHKEKKKVANDLKNIYKSATLEEAEMNLDEFCKKGDSVYPLIGRSWRSNWGRLSTFLAYPTEIRKVIYTTNAIESINMCLRKLVKTKSSFPNDQALLKILYLGLSKISKKWTMPIHDWGKAMSQFSILFGDRVRQS